MGDEKRKKIVDVRHGGKVEEKDPTSLIEEKKTEKKSGGKK